MKIVIFAVALLFFFPVSAQKDSLSLYSSQELMFHSAFEEDAFQCLAGGVSCHYMKNALATDSDITTQDYQQYKTRFYGFLDKLKENRRFRRKPEKQISFIFSEIHDEYFQLYTKAPLFSKIFTHGEFNCVTASALFAMAFDYYSIPYDIILLTDHVYLLAYPQQESIVVETTNPLRGAMQSYNQREKLTAVQSLVEMKVVTQEDVNRKGIDRVFSEVYLSEDNPSLHQLIGTMYYNEALQRSDEMLYEDAYELYKKASFMYPNRITTGLLLMTATETLDRADHKAPYTYRILGDLEKFIPFGIPPDAITRQGVSFLSKAVNEGNEPLMDSIYNWINLNITREEILEEVKFTYYYNKSLKRINEVRYDEALDILEIAYSIKPYDPHINLMFLDILTWKVTTESGREESYQLIKSIANKYPGLAHSKRFQMLYQGAMLSLINHCYVLEKFDLAENYRSEFELKFAPEDVDSRDIIRYLEEVYSRAALYYFRYNRISKAKEVVLSGLEYAPESAELKSKLMALR
ncbi:MAG: hypothetical protein ACOC12_04345 [Bacteroidota bacterium]